MIGYARSKLSVDDLKKKIQIDKVGLCAGLRGGGTGCFDVQLGTVKYTDRRHENGIHWYMHHFFLLLLVAQCKSQSGFCFRDFVLIL